LTKDTTLRHMVYIGIGLVVAEVAFSAFVAIPRMARHTELVRLGSIHAYSIFAIVQLIVGAGLITFLIRHRHDIRKIEGFLVIAGIVVIVLSFIMFGSAAYYLDEYRFYDVANLLSIWSAANLIAGILFIVVAIKLGRST
jgi:amino acid transporter